MILTPYTDVEAGDRAAGAPATANLAMALRDGAEHNRLNTYDPERHALADGEAHRHRGDDSEHVAKVVPNTPNMISRPYPSAGIVKGWIFHGTEPVVAGIPFSAGGQWASIPLGDPVRPYFSLSIFGGGAHLVVSGYVRADRELTAGSIQMGLSTGQGAKDSEDERTFVEGAAVTIPAALLAETWRRFWCVINTEGMEFTGSVRFVVQCLDSPLPVGGVMYASLFDVRVGRVLDYPVLGYVNNDELTSHPYPLAGGTVDWVGYGYAPTGGPPPPLDHAMAITSAVQLAPK